MRNAFPLFWGLAILFMAAGPVKAETNSTAGLWVGEVTLQRFNETVSGVNAANQVVSPNPSLTTPVSSPAHIRVILHVDDTAQVRLLKCVAMVDRSTNSTPDIVLLSDPNHYFRYGTQPGQRITAAAFDFGDGPAAQDALDAIARAAATAAVIGAAPTAAASAKVIFYQTNMPTGSSTAYSNFIQSTTFVGAASLAAASAVQGLVGLDVSVAASRKIEIAMLAAVNALKDAGIYRTADAMVLNEILLTGQLAAGGALAGKIYLGADHPTNPFRHKWNPIERHGYAITRNVSINFDSVASTNATTTLGFGVDYITGTYRENISGLHKPLGSNQDIGLLTDGIIKLERVSSVATLN